MPYMNRDNNFLYFNYDRHHGWSWVIKKLEDGELKPIDASLFYFDKRVDCVEEGTYWFYKWVDKQSDSSVYS